MTTPIANPAPKLETRKVKIETRGAFFEFLFSGFEFRTRGDQ
jgi:hypothetical protein